MVGGYYDDALRAAYRATMYENTQHNLENAISIYTNMNNHYNHFLNTLKDNIGDDCLRTVEDPDTDW